MKKIIVFLLMVAFFSNSYAQDDQTAKYKAMFTLNFIRYIGWPDATKEGDFIIGVLRNSMVLNHLQTQTVGKKFGYQNIVVKEFKKVEEVTKCQILFVSSSTNFGKNADALKQALGGKNSLIITETEGATKYGSMINFVVRDAKLKFELSEANAQAFGLKFSSSLTSLSNAITK